MVEQIVASDVSLPTPLEGLSEEPAENNAVDIGQCNEFQLPKSCTGDQLEALMDEMNTKRGMHLRLDASEVDRIDTPVIEMLIAAAKLWRNESSELEVSAMSESFGNSLELLGIEKTELESGGC